MPITHMHVYTCSVAQGCFKEKNISRVSVIPLQIPGPITVDLVHSRSLDTAILRMPRSRLSHLPSLEPLCSQNYNDCKRSCRIVLISSTRMHLSTRDHALTCCGANPLNFTCSDVDGRISTHTWA